MTLNEYQVLAHRTTNHELTNQGLIGKDGDGNEAPDV